VSADAVSADAVSSDGPAPGGVSDDPPADPAGSETYRILLVEDDPGDALLVEELLVDTRLDHELSWTQTLAAALDEVRRRAPDCILADLHLPDASGMRAVLALQEACPAAGVLVLTGMAESRAGVRAVVNGAQDYLVKGQVDPDQLRRALSYAIHRKRAERANAELRENRMRAQENARLERGLLPAPLLRTPTVTATMRYLPGRDQALLGGDFLDVVQTRDGMVHAVIGDVSGHGPDEAALGVCLRIAWRALVLAGHRGAEVLDHLEEVLVAERGPGESFATCTTLSLDPETGKGIMHLAGHHEPVLLTDRPGSARRLAAFYGTALGIAPGVRNWTATPLALPKSGALLLYTDGLVEGYVGAGDRRLGPEGLLELIAQAPEAAPDALLNHLVTSARLMNAGRHADDMAILYLGWRPEPDAA